MQLVHLSAAWHIIRRMQIRALFAAISHTCITSSTFLSTGIFSLFSLQLSALSCWAASEAEYSLPSLQFQSSVLSLCFQIDRIIILSQSPWSSRIVAVALHLSLYTTRHRQSFFWSSCTFWAYRKLSAIHCGNLGEWVIANSCRCFAYSFLRT